MTQIACEPKLRSVVRSFMHHAGPGTWLATGHVVVYVVVPGVSIYLVYIYEGNSYLIKL